MLPSQLCHRLTNPQSEHWYLQQPRSFGFFLNSLDPFFPAILLNHGSDITLRNTESLRFGAGNGLNLLPILLRCQTLKAFPHYAEPGRATLSLELQVRKTSNENCSFSCDKVDSETYHNPSNKKIQKSSPTNPNKPNKLPNHANPTHHPHPLT